MNTPSLYRAMFPLVLAAVAALLWAPLGELPLPRFEPMGPALFPQVILVCFMCLCVADATTALVRLRRVNAQLKVNCPPTPCVPFSVRLRPAACLAGFLLYLWLLDATDVPYIPLTFAFMTLGCWYLGNFTRRAFWLSILSSFGVTGLIYSIFGIVLQTFFP